MNQEEGPTFITILERAFCIMDCLLKSSQPMGISPLSKMTKIPKANTFHIIKTLTALDAVTPIGEGYIFSVKVLKIK